MSMMNKRKMIFLFSAEIWILLNDFKRISVSVSRPCNAKYVCWSRIWECIVKTKPSIETTAQISASCPVQSAWTGFHGSWSDAHRVSSKERTMETMTDIIFDNHKQNTFYRWANPGKIREILMNAKMINKPVKSSERGFSYGQLGSAARNWS